MPFRTLLATAFAVAAAAAPVAAQASPGLLLGIDDDACRARLSGWQSGLLYPDWTPKPAFTAYLQALAAARAGTIACAPK